VFLPLLEFPSCMNNCGHNLGSCSCNYNCHNYGICCPDYDSEFLSIRQILQDETQIFPVLITWVIIICDEMAFAESKETCAFTFLPTSFLSPLFTGYCLETTTETTTTETTTTETTTATTYWIDTTGAAAIQLNLSAH